jgi:hypothetical protein
LAPNHLTWKPFNEEHHELWLESGGDPQFDSQPFTPANDMKLALDGLHGLVERWDNEGATP